MKFLDLLLCQKVVCFYSRVDIGLGSQNQNDSQSQASNKQDYN